MKFLAALVLLYSLLISVRFSHSGLETKAQTQPYIPDERLPPASSSLLSPLYPGDTLKIVLESPAESTLKLASYYRVDADGTLALPGLDRPIMAKGLSLSQLDWFIEQIYHEKGILTAPDFRVLSLAIPLEGPDVIVGGEVKSGGREVIWVPGLRLFDAIARAGGLTEYADAKRVQLIRGGKTLLFDVSTRQQDNSNNPLLFIDDTIFVREKH